MHSCVRAESGAYTSLKKDQQPSGYPRSDQTLNNKDMNSIKENFMKVLHKKRQRLKQTTIEKCDVILDFCPIVSRAGTDINAALNRLDSLQVLKPIILVVLHHTFDTEKVIPDSNTAVNREDMLAVDCLFYEDKGLLQCQKNKDAVEKIVEHLKSQKLTSYALSEDHASPHLGQIRKQKKRKDKKAICGWISCCVK